MSTRASRCRSRSFHDDGSCLPVLVVSVASQSEAGSLRVGGKGAYLSLVLRHIGGFLLYFLSGGCGIWLEEFDGKVGGGRVVFMKKMWDVWWGCGHERLR
jgi:hypothetical protein